MILFLDACALIYLLEGKESFSTLVHAEIAFLAKAHPSARIALSRLSWLECRVGPLKKQDLDLLARYDAFFACPDIIWIELDSKVVELATTIRAHDGLRTPDALQAASCLKLGTDHLFMTGDSAFSRVHGLNIHLFQNG